MVACSSKDVLRKTLLEGFVCQNLSLSLACKMTTGIKSWMQTFSYDAQAGLSQAKFLFIWVRGRKLVELSYYCMLFLDCCFIE